MSFADKLSAAKEKAALREFEVTITETLQKTVKVMAKDQCEAEEAVQSQWDDEIHVLDADHFKGVVFSAAPAAKEHKLARRGEER
jgi:hypothetical protein